MSKYGMQAKFTAKTGQRDVLANMLLEAAAGLQSIKDCELYIVSVPETDPNAVWVTEVWSSSEAHKASLSLEETKAAIQRAKPLIDGIEAVELKPLGGKGIIS